MLARAFLSWTFGLLSCSLYSFSVTSWFIAVVVLMVQYGRVVYASTHKTECRRDTHAFVGLEDAGCVRFL